MSHTEIENTEPLTTVGSITTLDGKRRTRRRPVGFAPPKPAPKKKPATRKRKES